MFPLLNIFVSYPSPGKAVYEVTYRKPDMTIHKESTEHINIKLFPRSWDLELYDPGSKTLYLTPSRLSINEWKKE